MAKFKWRNPKHAKDKKPTEHKDPERQEESRDQHPNVAGRVVIELGHDLKKQHETEHIETTSHNKWQLWETFITAGLVFIYTFVAIYQAYLTANLWNLSRERSLLASLKRCQLMFRVETSM